MSLRASLLVLPFVFVCGNPYSRLVKNLVISIFNWEMFVADQPMWLLTSPFASCCAARIFFPVLMYLGKMLASVVFSVALPDWLIGSANVVFSILLFVSR